MLLFFKLCFYLRMPNLWIMGSFHLLFCYWMSCLSRVLAMVWLHCPVDSSGSGFSCHAPGEGVMGGVILQGQMKQHHFWSGGTAHPPPQHSGVQSCPCSAANRGLGPWVWDFWVNLRDIFYMLLARKHSAGTLCGMEEQWGGGGTFLIQWEKTQALGAQVRALPYFTEAKWAFLNLLKSKDLQGFLIWAPAAREWTVPVGRHWHKCLPTAWDAVCVFWFSFLIIFLQSVPGPPSGALWIVDCPWAPQSNAELDDC